MDVNALRIWGLAVTSALIVAALVIARAPETARAEAPLAGVFEIAQAETNAAPSGFIVRFRGTGPIARAQVLGQRNEAEARRRIEAQLARQSGFAGLCFDRFTVGAAEVVLRTCESVVASERAQVEARWLARLRDMRAVAYADLNAVAGQNRAG